MAPPTLTSRAKWIEVGLDALASGGPDAVRVEPLAASLGVTRGGFYGHFASRAAFLEALLDSWEQAAIEDVLERVERRGGDARARVVRAGALTFSDDLLPVELAVRDWARHDPPVAARLRRVDNKRMELLRAYFSAPDRSLEDIEARAVLAFALAIGSHFMAADHGTMARDEAIKAAFALIL